MKIMSSATTNLLFGALTMMYHLQYKFPQVFYTQTFGFRWYDFDILQKNIILRQIRALKCLDGGNIFFWMTEFLHLNINDTWMKTQYIILNVRIRSEPNTATYKWDVRSCLLGDGHCRGTDTTGKIHFAPPQHKKFYQLSLLCCFSILPHKFNPMMTYFW